MLLKQHRTTDTDIISMDGTCNLEVGVGMNVEVEVEMEVEVEISQLLFPPLKKKY